MKAYHVPYESKAEKKKAAAKQKEAQKPADPEAEAKHKAAMERKELMRKRIEEQYSKMRSSQQKREREKERDLSKEAEVAGRFRDFTKAPKTAPTMGQMRSQLASAEKAARETMAQTAADSRQKMLGEQRALPTMQSVAYNVDTCRECRGRGVGLVTHPNGLCEHCHMLKNGFDFKKAARGIVQQIRELMKQPGFKRATQGVRPNAFFQSGLGAKDRRTDTPRDIDPMDPAAYSDTPFGKWSTGTDRGRMADATAVGPLFQQRPYPAPSSIAKLDRGSMSDDDYLRALSELDREDHKTGKALGVDDHQIQLAQSFRGLSSAFQQTLQMEAALEGKRMVGAPAPTPIGPAERPDGPPPGKK